MKKCLIIINDAAGGSKKISFEKVEKCLGEAYAYTRSGFSDSLNYEGYDAVAICGGDGTLGSVLGKIYDKPIEVWYFPSGTLNDKAKAARYDHALTKCPSCGGSAKGKQAVVGFIGDDSGKHLFAYVFAAGAFTPIGYKADVEKKKKFGIGAYLVQVLKEYKIHRIKADIDVCDKHYEGEFALIMFVKSPRCFGFRFNKAFDAESASGHLVAIRSPKHNGLLGKIEMFFPFFRVFFMGLKREREGKIIFKKVYNASVFHEEQVDYCRDGELKKSSGYAVKFDRTICSFNVINKF